MQDAAAEALAIVERSMRGFTSDGTESSAAVSSVGRSSALPGASRPRLSTNQREQDGPGSGRCQRDAGGKAVEEPGTRRARRIRDECASDAPGTARRYTPSHMRGATSRQHNKTGAEPGASATAAATAAAPNAAAAVSCKHANTAISGRKAMRPVQPSVAAQFELVGSGTVGASVRGRHGHNTHGHNTKRRALLLDDSQWAEPSVHAGWENGFPVGRERTEQNLALQTDQPRRTSQENSAPESVSAVPPTVSRAADCDGAADTMPSDEESVLEQQQEQLERDLIELKRKKAQVRLGKLEQKLKAEAAQSLQSFEDDVQVHLQGRVMELMHEKERNRVACESFQADIVEQMARLQAMHDSAAVEASELERQYDQSVKELEVEHARTVAERRRQLDADIARKLEDAALPEDDRCNPSLLTDTIGVALKDECGEDQR